MFIIHNLTWAPWYTCWLCEIMAAVERNFSFVPTTLCAYYCANRRQTWLWIWEQILRHSPNGIDEGVELKQQVHERFELITPLVKRWRSKLISIKAFIPHLFRILIIQATHLFDIYSIYIHLLPNRINSKRGYTLQIDNIWYL